MFPDENEIVERGAVRAGHEEVHGPERHHGIVNNIDKHSQEINSRGRLK